MFRPEFFYLLIYKPSYYNFLESRKKKIFFFFLFYLPTLKIIFFVKKNNIVLRFCLCIFESDTVKVIILFRFLGKFKNLIKTVGLTSFTVLSGDIKKKKKALKMIS